MGPHTVPHTGSGEGTQLRGGASCLLNGLLRAVEPSHHTPLVSSHSFPRAKFHWGVCVCVCVCVCVF